MSSAGDSLELYLKEIEGFPLLNVVEEQDLARRVKSGDRSAAERLIIHNLRLVVKIAGHYRGKGLDMEDLISEGNLGLHRAVESFDPDRGYRFATYATWWIRQAIVRALEKYGRTIRLPSHLVRLLNRCLLEKDRFQREFGTELSAGELAARLGVGEETVDRLLRISAHPLSLEVPLGEGNEGATLGDFLQDPRVPLEELVLMNLEKGELERMLGTLNERERVVLYLRFGLGGGDTCTLMELGRKLGISRERVRQIQLEAMGKLRSLLVAPGLAGVRR